MTISYKFTMKKIFAMIILLSIFVVGCNINTSIKLKESDVIDISYHYFERVYTNAMFFSNVAITLNEMDASDNRKLEYLIYYMDGYKKAMERVNLYNDVEKIVFDNALSKYYDQELLYDTKTVLRELNLLVFKLSHNIKQQLNRPIDSNKMKQISNSLHDLSRNLYPFDSTPAQDDLTLYNIFVYPKIIVRNYSSAEIRQRIESTMLIINKISESIQE
ncbi:hypothetical protein BHF71_01655 [Vulcanibacillus modesticaldus]|uniref:Uncharacterized protein n=1 Tax=Vulcanibacillus modesticaldus TaxID=337097 RepID=A0A1D2YUD7_9BACI|nr:hypothetical protein [Vulcanibacillus modesticaldus]OEF99322.1 hypothetical protein BHF71_01655 [Vulcanibacillus modesticaldus]